MGVCHVRVVNVFLMVDCSGIIAGGRTVAIHRLFIDRSVFPDELLTGYEIDPVLPHSLFCITLAEEILVYGGGANVWFVPLHGWVPYIAIM